MNELTKHELIMMGQLARREYILNHEKSWVGIIDKIQSMIDNYCEHSETKQNSEVDYILCCAKCDAFKGWV